MEELNDEALDKVAGGASVLDGILGLGENAPSMMQVNPKKNYCGMRKQEDSILFCRTQAADNLGMKKEEDGVYNMRSNKNEN